VRSGSTPSEGTNFSQSGSDWINSSSTTTLKSRASFNTMPSGSARASSSPAASGTRSARSSSRSRIPASWCVKPSATPWPKTCVSWSRRWSVRKTSSICPPTAPTTFAAGAAAYSCCPDSRTNAGPTASSRPTRSWPPKLPTPSPPATTATPRSMI